MTRDEIRRRETRRLQRAARDASMHAKCAAEGLALQADTFGRLAQAIGVMGQRRRA